MTLKSHLGNVLIKVVLYEWYEWYESGNYVNIANNHLPSGFCEDLMGPLQLAVTWYKIRHAGEQAVHWDIQNKATSSR